MGILDKIFRRKKRKAIEVEGAERYILKKQGPGGGMTKVMELKEPQPIEDLYENLVPGIYSLHLYRKGQTGFEVVWGPVEVLGEKPAAAAPRRQGLLGPLSVFVKEISAIKEEGKEALETLNMLFGEKTVSMEDAMAYLDKLKEHKNTLDSLFPGATTKSQEIPVSGSIPALAVYAPTMVDQSLDALEKRMVRWGFLSKTGEGALPEGAGIIKLPKRPEAKVPTKAEAEKEVEKAVEKVKIELPKKPAVEKKAEEVREEKVGESSAE